MSIKLNGENSEVIDVNKKYNDKKAKSSLFGKNISKEISIKLDDEYKEPGFKAIDNYDKDITNKVIVENKVDTSKEGNYEVIYTVKDSSNNEVSVKRFVKVYKEEVKINTVSNKSSSQQTGLTYIKGILLVNKNYSLPASYNPGVDLTASNALKQLQSAASNAGFSIPMLSGFRSYNYQVNLYNRYVSQDGQEVADTYSACPGHSEHQTGLAFDVGQIDYDYGSTASGIWLVNNCANYGFILRYPQGKQAITGYKYEPWHIRYVGDAAKTIMNSGLTFEEYLGV